MPVFIARRKRRASVRRSEYSFQVDDSLDTLSTAVVSKGTGDTYLYQPGNIHQAHRKRGGWGGFSLPNKLLKFVDFENEKGCESQGRRNKYSNTYIFEEASRIYQNAISFNVIEIKDFKIFRERLSLVVIFAFVSGTFSKNGAFSSDLKGVVMRNFPGGMPPDPNFCSLPSRLISAPPQYEVRSHGPVHTYIF